MEYIHELGLGVHNNPAYSMYMDLVWVCMHSKYEYSIYNCTVYDLVVSVHNICNSAKTHLYALVVGVHNNPAYSMYTYCLIKSFYR